MSASCGPRIVHRGKPRVEKWLRWWRVTWSIDWIMMEYEVFPTWEKAVTYALWHAWAHP